MNRGPGSDRTGLLPDLALGETGIVGVVGVGIDVVDIERVRRALARTPRFEHRVFTAAEIEHCRSGPDPESSFAARFAAKEAVLKALGLGIFAAPLNRIEVVGGGDAAPELVVDLGPTSACVARWLLSLSHDGGVAAAVAVAVGKRSTPAP